MGKPESEERLVESIQRKSDDDLVTVHSHPLRAPAHFAVCGRADRSAAVALCAALLERQQLLSTEGLVVNLRSSLDEIL